MTLLDILLFAAIPVAMWLLFIRPAKSRRDAQAALVASLTPGARIMTTAGVFGTIVAVGDEAISVRIAEGVVIEMVPHAVARVLPEPQRSEEPAGEAVGVTADPGAPAADDALPRTADDSPADAADGSAPILDGDRG